MLQGLRNRLKKQCSNTYEACAEDVRAVFRNDPAARSLLEVLTTYPGLHALWMHRAAHCLWGQDRRLLARLLSHSNRFWTGVEIHPGAKIGAGVFIDHGMGVVVGETATIGDGCVLFKGVVLGGTQSERCVRHPQLGKYVVVGTNACILGHIDVGDGAKIGSGSVVVRPVPQGATVVGVPGRVVPRNGDKHARFEATLDHASLPDPVQTMLRSMRAENDRLSARLETLETKLGLPSGETNEDDHLIDAELSTSDLPSQHGG